MWIAVAVLGGLGAIARFVVDAVIREAIATKLPVGTLVVNVSGSFLLGLVCGLALSGDALVLAGTATLGSYTTFSTWMLETERAREQDRPSIAILNVVVSLLVGFGAVALGRTIGAHL
jgi:CrcB protein